MTTTTSAAISAASDVRHSPPIAKPDADDRRREQPERRRAEHRARPRRSRCRRAPSPMPAANRTVITTTASSAATPPASDPRRARAAASRAAPPAGRSVSSDAHLATNVAAGEPDRDEEQLDVQLEPAAGRVVKSKPGKICWKIGRSARSRRRSGRRTGRPARQAARPSGRRPMPHASARGSWSPNARLTGPWSRGRRRAASAARGRPSRRGRAALNSATPTDHEHDAEQRRSRATRQPVVHADERDVVDRPAERAERRPSGPPTSSAVGEPEHASSRARRPRPSPPGRAAARAGTRARRRTCAIDADPEREPEAPSERDLVAEGRVAERSIELTVSSDARGSTIASHSRVRCAASFSSAIRRLPSGVVATMSRLPRRASAASVPDRAMIDHSAVPSTKMAPYFQVDVAAQRARVAHAACRTG